jgi:hypothetical protein
VQSPAAVAVDAAGNVFVTGGFVGTINFAAATTCTVGPSSPACLASAGGNDVFVAKYDNTLATNLWAVRFGGTGDQAGQSVGIDGNGDVVLGGLFAGGLDFGAAGALTSMGSADAFTATLNGATGVPKCARRAGDASVQATSGVAVNRANNEQYFFGSFISSINWGVTNLVGNANSSETFLVRLR